MAGQERASGRQGLAQQGLRLGRLLELEKAVRPTGQDLGDQCLIARFVIAQALSQLAIAQPSVTIFGNAFP